MIYIVMGMHKSGTSLMARLLHKSGVDMGEGLFLGADHINQEGYYENVEFTRNNQNLLISAGGNWDKPVEVNEPTLETERTVERNKKGIWGWKDPRTAFTFECYRPYLDKFVLVFMKRDKQAVVESMEKTHRHQSKADFGKLYDIYWEQNEKLIKKYPNIVFNYDSIIDNVNPNLRHHK
jgi:hypothetical protein